jgi:hypothetical protein
MSGSSENENELLKGIDFMNLKNKKNFMFGPWSRSM